MTLYKHILGRRRILIYTLPPVEAACILCQVAADICYEAQQQGATTKEDNTTQPGTRRLRGKSAEPISVLGMVNLSDMDYLHLEGQTGRGWIACKRNSFSSERQNYMISLRYHGRDLSREAILL